MWKRMGCLKRGKEGSFFLVMFMRSQTALVIICSSMTVLPLVFSFYDGGGPCGAWVEY